jgi:hypothetical protein
MTQVLSNKNGIPPVKGKRTMPDGRKSAASLRCAAVCIAVLLTLQSCYTYRVIPDHASANKTASGDTTLYAYLWGLSPPATVVPQNSRGNGTAKVEVKKHVGHFLLTIITFGVVSPMNLRWECAADNE